MSKIKINHAEVRSLAKTYDKAEQDIEGMLQKLKSTQSNLETIWEGKAWEQFNQTYNEFTPKVKKFGQFLGSVGDQLKENAKVMEETDRKLQDANKIQK